MMKDPLAGFEAPHLKLLRKICEEIGYGRVEQVVEGWFEEMHPGHIAAKRAVYAEEHAEKTQP